MLGQIGLLEGVVFVKSCALRLLQRSGFLAVFLPAFLCFTACQNTTHDDNNPAGAVDVKVAVSQNGKYELRTVRLTSLSDMQLLQGEAAHFLFSPGISHGQLSGFEPRVHLMRTKDGT